MEREKSGELLPISEEGKERRAPASKWREKRESKEEVASPPLFSVYIRRDN